LEVPEVIRRYVATQLGSLFDISDTYLWEGRSRERHQAEIRSFTGWQVANTEHKKDLFEWLRVEGAISAFTAEKLQDMAIAHLRARRIERPAPSELERIANSALAAFFDDMYRGIADCLSAQVQRQLDQLLEIEEGQSLSPLEQLKRDAGEATNKNLQTEAAKLKRLRAVTVPQEAFRAYPWKLLSMLARRAANDNVWDMRRHPDIVRRALLAIFIHVRTAELIDDVVKMFINQIQGIKRKSKRKLRDLLLAGLPAITNKFKVLKLITEVVLTDPDKTIREAILPVTSLETFERLQREFQLDGGEFSQLFQELMKRKYVRGYRRALPALLDSLDFRAEGWAAPLVEALSAIRRELGQKRKHFQESVPIQGIVTRRWQGQVFDTVNGKQRVTKHFYEICVLEKLQRALKCKQAWVVGAQAHRDPKLDLPAGWDDQQRRAAHYEKLGQPLSADQFVDQLRTRMTESLARFDGALPTLDFLKLVPSKQESGRDLFKLSPLEAQQKPTRLGEVKERISKKFGMLDLLDVFVEADRLTEFTRFFRHSGTKEVRSRDALRPLLLLALFGEGTNTGIKRIAAANNRYSLDELQYIRKMYLSPQALRDANAEVVNKLLQIRNPRFWGRWQTCASDGKRFPSWSQNLTSERRTRYDGDGVLVYWHVETNAVCIYSQLRSFSSSEVGSMMEGLIRHDTEMRVEKNFVDSHGQSEVAFAFCHLLKLVRLMPRLKRIKYERLYLPTASMSTKIPSLKGVIARPIRWDLIIQQYDEMVRAAIGLKDGTATADAVLRRFNSFNRNHPTYKALAEVGKAEKTIYLCEYLASRELQREVHEGLQVVENWNATNDFICYGRQGEIATNRREQQEITVLSLQLLQNCLMLINTILVEDTLKADGLWEQLESADRRGLTPLFYSHINPYGHFELNLDRPLLEEAA
jgi:TnpA family transposase